ncbi:MAG: hypothetical protein E6R03_17190 [Hyphomicrobiaceae bacterium]|nr:MAG: hypothetical protein E6R03_17190 [Hyphomicrobiaceae bacterium]
MRHLAPILLCCALQAGAQRYELRRAIAPAALSFAAGAAWGTHETLMHHNARFFEVFPRASRRFWGPDSWQNKYENPWYVPVQVSDGKHLTATMHHVALFSAGVTITLGERRPAKHYLFDAGVSLAAYSLGNWLAYDLLF